MKNLKLLIEYTKNLNVLYVEDDLELLETTRELLENFFLRLDVAKDGQEGLEKYLTFNKEKGFSYDLVVTDINMPNMNGLDMSVQMLKTSPMQSIVITSAHNEIEFLSKAIDIGIEAKIKIYVQISAPKF